MQNRTIAENPVASIRTVGAAGLARAIETQRASTLLAVAELRDAQWLGAPLSIVNPPLWELGHIAWFHERWVLRECSGEALLPSISDRADSLYDSSLVAHDTRWQLELADSRAIRQYLAQVLELALSSLQSMADTDPRLYFHRLALFHEMMHREAFCYSWQTHGYPAPADLAIAPSLADQQWLSIEAVSVNVGSEPETGFVFDNEKWASQFEVDEICISNRPVSYAEFAAFVLDGGYQRAEFWPSVVWQQMQEQGCKRPRYWRCGSNQNSFEVRCFDRWIDLPKEQAMTHVSAYEAQAWCRWAGRQLPTEAQWLAASVHPQFQWGAVWEWTDTVFAALPGFSADAYKEYSAPWFGTHRVLKGASPATPTGLHDRRFRNFYEPFRGDVFNGFRVLIPSR